MKVNPTTMLIEDFGEYDKDRILELLGDFVILGKHNAHLHDLFLDWREQCSLPQNQGLLLMSTAFPQRVLLSMMEV